MLWVYQIGNTPVHYPQETWPGEKLESRGSPVNLLWASDVSWPNSRFIFRETTYESRFILLTDDSATASQKYQRLKSIVGMQTEVIGYFIDECCGCQPVWVSNYGVLQAIEGKQEVINGPLEVEIKIITGPYWSPLNRMFWTWQSSYYHDLFVRQMPIIIRQYPDCNSILKTCSSWWNRRPVNEDAMYNPDNWNQIFEFPGENYPVFGLSSGWTAKPNHYLFSDVGVWGAPNSDLYAFRNLQNVNQIQIKVRREKRPGEIVTETTTINLATTNARLQAKGLQPLNNTDIVFVGDMLHKPGFIWRNNARITNVYPAVSYPGWWPGMTGVGNSRVEFTVGSAQTAFIHFFRKL